MPVAVPRFGAEECPLLPPVRVEDLEGLVIRPATVRDVHGMSALINQYAAANVMLARGPQYLYQHIQDYMVAVTPAADGKTPGGGGLRRAACAVGRSGRDPFAGGARRLSGPRPGPPGWWLPWWNTAAPWACRACLPLPWRRHFLPAAVSASTSATSCRRGLGGVQQVPEVLLL